MAVSGGRVGQWWLDGGGRRREAAVGVAVASVIQLLLVKWFDGGNF